MCDTGYSVKQLVDDLRGLRARALPEPEMLEAARARVKRLLLMKHNWLRPSMCKPGPDASSAGVYKLHEEPDHALAIFVVTWLPNDETPPHDHATWAIIAGLQGHETQHWWKRLDDGSVPGHAEVERAKAERIDDNSIITMPSEAIHSVHNDSGELSVTLHVYGMNVDYTDRHKYDPVSRTTAPYRLGGTAATA